MQSREATLKRKCENAKRYAKDPRHKTRFDARRAVRDAVKRGDLTRLPCEKCGEAVSFAHHPDYSKPLEVEWLCRPCHTAEHVFPRKERCPKGHAYSGANVRIRFQNGRYNQECRACDNIHSRIKKAKIRALKANRCELHDATRICQECVPTLVGAKA